MTDPTPAIDPRRVHEFLTEKIFPRQAGVVTTAELEQLLTAGSASS